MLFLNLLLLVALCHSQDLDAIMAEISEMAPTPVYEVSQTTDYVVTYVTEAAVVETTQSDVQEFESSRRKRQDVTPENAIDAGSDIGGDLDAIIAQISEATTPAATEAPIENADSWVTPDSTRK